MKLDISLGATLCEATMIVMPFSGNSPKSLALASSALLPTWLM